MIPTVDIPFEIAYREELPPEPKSDYEEIRNQTESGFAVNLFEPGMTLDDIVVNGYTNREFRLP